MRLRFDLLTKTKQPELHWYWTTRLFMARSTAPCGSAMGNSSVSIPSTVRGKSGQCTYLQQCKLFHIDRIAGSSYWQACPHDPPSLTKNSSP